MALGNAAGFNATTGNNNVYIGVNVPGAADESNACYIASIYDQVIDVESGFFMAVDGNNKLGTRWPSGPSVRIKDVVKALKKIEELENTVAALTTQLKEQAARIER